MRLHQKLLRYGRKRNFHLVCGSFRSSMRNDKKYKQWKRLCDRASVREMSPVAKQALESLLGHRILLLKERHTAG